MSRCPVQECQGEVRQGHALCRSCWAQVPRELQVDLYRAAAALRRNRRRNLDAYRWALSAATVAVELALNPKCSLLCVSCPQPWPWAVLRAGCRALPQPTAAPVPPGRRLWVALHAPKEIDAAGLAWMRDALLLDAEVTPVQAVVAVASLKAVVAGDLCQDAWARGSAWAWLLEGVVRLPQPAPYVSREPFWLPTEDLLCEIRAQWRAGRNAPPELVTETLKPTYPWDDQ